MPVYNKAYKFRLMPNKEQRVLFAKTFGCTRFVWNKLLDHAIRSYQQLGKMELKTPAYFKEEFSFLKEVDSLALANSQLNLKKAFTAFFAKTSNHPRFKSKKDTKQSYTTNNQEASNALRIEGSYIRLPKVGWVKFICHRNLKAHEKIKTCTLQVTGTDRYYISVTVEGTFEVEPIVIRQEKVLGLDFSMGSLFVTSEGKKANYPRYYRISEEKLKNYYRSVTRKKKGSNNRHKARIKLARYHERIAHMRNDFLHKVSFALATNYDALVTEDLNMQNFSKALRFGKSVSDVAWGKFIRLLAYKLAERGKKLIQVDTWFASSKLCSSCGSKKEDLALSERIYICEHCGYQDDRDINAALNIKNRWNGGDSLAKS
jgi:putative transposase